jgi:hypothetical protein
MRTALTAFVGVAAVLTAPAVSAYAQVAGFADVPQGHWAAGSVAKLATAGIVKGNSSAPLGGAQTPARAATAGQTKAAPKPAYNGNKPVTRYELAVTLYRFVQYIEMANSQKKGKTKVQVAPVVDGPTAVKRLIAGGYLPKNTPLATNGSQVVTANQLADAMAQIIARNREKATPVTPGSLRTLEIDHPPTTPGT